MRFRFTFASSLLGGLTVAASAAVAQTSGLSSSLPPATADDIVGVQATSFVFNPTAPTTPPRSGPTLAAEPASPAPAANTVADEIGAKTSSRSTMPDGPWAYSGSVDPADDGYQGRWYAVAYALGMTRNRAPAYWLTNTTNDFYNFQMNSQSAGADWSGGGQVTVAYAWRGCDGPQLAFTYWGLSPMDGHSQVNDTTGNPATALSSTLDFSGVTINGQSGSHYFDSAQEQALWRRDRADNLEMNLHSGTYTVGSLQVAGLAGFRFFRFTDHLLYGSASFGNSFNNGAESAYLRLNTTNNLFGGQVGAVISSIMTERLTVYATPKVGLMANQMNDLQQIFSGDPSAPMASNYHTYKNDFSVLSELDAGLTYALSDHCRFITGYRVLAISNIALADNQYFAYSHVEQNGGLILHGVFMGLGWTL